jgi:hypothetical protein
MNSSYTAIFWPNRLLCFSAFAFDDDFATQGFRSLT